MDVFVDEVRQLLIELEGQIDAIFHIIIREDEPVGRVRARRA